MQSTPSAALYPGVEFRCMNTTVAAIGRTLTPLPYWNKPVVQGFAEIEQTASRFLENSELSKLNRHPEEQPFTASYLLFQLLYHAWDYALRTDFLFQPFIGTAIKRMGYDRSFEQLEHAEAADVDRFNNHLNEQDHDSYQAVSNPYALEFDKQFMTICKHSHEELDLGGIGKGWAVDRAAALMRRNFNVSSGLVDAGGDLCVWSDDAPWCIGIQHPEDEHIEIMQLWIKEACTATSNVLHRRWKQGERIRHHLLDGRTGLPAMTDIVQATVLSSSTVEAEIAAKIICMLGSDAASAWMKSHFPHLGYIIIKQSGEIVMNQMVSHYAVKVV